MSGIIALLDQPRTLDALGRPTSATISFYLTGTTTLADIYSDEDLTTPAANPVVISSGQIFPDIYLDPSISYRRYIVYGDGSIHDIDPLSNDVSAGAITFSHASTYSPGTVGAKLQDLVSVKDAPYNAKGDGVTNDRAAINAALADNHRVYFPAGTYLISGGSIELPDGVNGIVMVGDGIATKLTGGNINGVVLINSHEGVYISDMWIETTIEAFGCISSFHQEIADVVIERVKFSTSGALLTNGIKMVMDDSIVGLDGFTVRDCVFDQCGRMGVEIQNNNTMDTVPRYRNIYIGNNKFLRSGEAVGGGISAGMAVSLTGDGVDCEIVDNYFDQCTGPSIEIIGTSRLTIDGNKIRRPKARAIQLANTTLMSDNIVTNNEVYEIDGTLGGGVFLGSMVNSIIANNSFDLTGRSGIFVELTASAAAGTGKNLFTGNVVRTNASTALVIDGCPDNVVTGNRFDNSLSGANTAPIICNGATSVRNAVFGNYVAKGTGGTIFSQSSGATNNIFGDFYSLEAGAVFSRNANGGSVGFAIYDPPSIAAGGVATTTVTVTGAVAADFVQVSIDLNPGGLLLFGAVTAANTVTVTFYNPTAAPIDLGPVVLRAVTTPSSG